MHGFRFMLLSRWAVGVGVGVGFGVGFIFGYLDILINIFIYFIYLLYT